MSPGDGTEPGGWLILLIPPTAMLAAEALYVAWKLAVLLLFR